MLFISHNNFTRTQIKHVEKGRKDRKKNDNEKAEGYIIYTNDNKLMIKIDLVR